MESLNVTTSFSKAVALDAVLEEDTGTGFRKQLNRRFTLIHADLLNEPSLGQLTSGERNLAGSNSWSPHFSLPQTKAFAVQLRRCQLQKIFASHVKSSVKSRDPQNSIRHLRVS